MSTYVHCWCIFWRVLLLACMTPVRQYFFFCSLCCWCVVLYLKWYFCHLCQSSLLAGLICCSISFACGIYFVLAIQYPSTVCRTLPLISLIFIESLKKKACLPLLFSYFSGFLTKAGKLMSAIHLHDSRWQGKRNTAPGFSTQASSAWKKSRVAHILEQQCIEL